MLWKSPCLISAWLYLSLGIPAFLLNSFFRTACFVVVKISHCTQNEAFLSRELCPLKFTSTGDGRFQIAAPAVQACFNQLEGIRTVAISLHTHPTHFSTR